MKLRRINLTNQRLSVIERIINDRIIKARLNQLIEGFPSNRSEADKRIMFLFGSLSDEVLESLIFGE